MVDSPPQKNDEQYPLLKVESGGGDIGRPPAQLAAAPGWNVTCSSKRSWYERWPELISACWMTGMLLSIFLLIIYGLGTLGVIRKHPYYLLNCTSSRLDNEVFYHHIVQRGEHVQFSRFSDYLSNMASQYSSLRFSVFFLIDDSMQLGYRGQRNSRIINKLLPYHTMRENGICDAFNQRELVEFQFKHPNVNITIMPLTKFMAMTPLKYKWRTIPMSYLTFYARVFSVWKNGGVGIDLDVFSDQYNKHQTPDRRMTAIIKHYNKGTKPEEYANTLNNIDRDEQNEFFRIFYSIVHQILNETQAFFKRTTMSNEEISSKPVIRTHRNKRDLLETPHNILADLNATVAISNTKLTNTADLTIIDAPYENSYIVEPNKTNDASNEKTVSSTTSERKSLVTDLKVKSLIGDQKPENKSGKMLETPLGNVSDVQHVLLFYDFSVFSDNNGPPYDFPVMQANPPQADAEDDIGAVKTKKAKYFLSLTMEGSFIVAVSKQHPFLGHIISSGCQRMPPRFVIQDAIMSQCSSILHDDVYCSNIYVF